MFIQIILYYNINLKPSVPQTINLRNAEILNETSKSDLEKIHAENL